MKYNCKFILEKRKNKEGELIVDRVPIFIDLTYAGNRLRYATGYRVDAIKWDEEKQHVNKNALAYLGSNAIKYNVVNSKLDEFKGAVAELLGKTSEVPDKSVIIHAFDLVSEKAKQKKLKLEKLEDNMTIVFDVYINSVRLSTERTKQLTSNYQHLVRFSRKTKTRLYFKNWDANTLIKFEQYLFEDGQSGEYDDIKGNHKPKPKGVNAVACIMKRTRAFFRWALKNDFIDIYPFAKYQIPAETYGRPIFLTKEERDRLYDANIENDRLAKVRDIFVFQCLVGCRVGDLVKLTHENIQGNNLVYIAEKTKSEKAETRIVPLSEKARTILSRYNEPDGRLLPFITDQRYNDYLKELFETLELNRIVTRLNPQTGETEHVPLYSVASSHMARRTFIGLLYKKVKDDVIGSMSGHVKGSKAFTRYYDIDEEMKQEAINLLD